MEKRSRTIRFSLGIPCEIGKFNRETGNWICSEGLIRKVDGQYLILETEQKLKLDEGVRLTILNRRWDSFNKGDKKPQGFYGRDQLSLDANVVRYGKQPTDEQSGYCVKVSTESFTGTYYSQDQLVERRNEERRKGERRITDNEIVEFIELASEIGMENVVFRSGYYVPKSTRQPSAERRAFMDRRV
ncbi:MAG: hypothetical protein D8M57_09195 [Candidatus Scalindua sp. AMX11]|nr:MAG: hypothetical protein DWQ00_00575 [Candidatus Scalindua sp.]NOG83032.1 hypothetical protein [Planctomycetota bacterium]RZV79567.1 MAG: hypothetical protein EX341_11065 [Candidatus Scalindua sp. SCAELEC01]TDE65207.1 MAG: hypothetical protein D8M57_09195 [Candidatus Scalindua sp. AMX11]GJQ58557.1 MAG: hypothetical protein SCALA701_13580 [Candidatus Scalindua sp.]